MTASENDLTELEMRVLSELEEANEENVFCLMNTVTDQRGTADEVDSMQRALGSLVRADLVRLAVDREELTQKLRRLPQHESLTVIAGLNTILIFDREGQHWTSTEKSGPPYMELFPSVLNTPAGNDKGFEILDARGYQWWRRKS